MKTNTNIFAGLVFLIALFAGVLDTFAQKEPVVGGYAEVSVKDKNVIKAAKFAVKERAKTQNTKVNLVEIKNAKIQVVAGANYEVCMMTNYLNKKSSKLVDQFVKVVVHRNLKNKFSLTEWTQENCTEQ